jgi:hypothetical protein
MCTQKRMYRCFRVKTVTLLRFCEAHLINHLASFETCPHSRPFRPIVSAGEWRNNSLISEVLFGEWLRGGKDWSIRFYALRMALEGESPTKVYRE